MTNKNKKLCLIFGILFGVLLLVWGGFYIQKRSKDNIIFIKESSLERGYGGATENVNWKIGFLNESDKAVYYLPAKFELIFLFPEPAYSSIDGDPKIPNTHNYMD